jgi:hypothetical protein
VVCARGLQRGSQLRQNYRDASRFPLSALGCNRGHSLLLKLAAPARSFRRVELSGDASGLFHTGL